MAPSLCCTGDDRADSPDAPGARIPVILPASRQLLPRSQIHPWGTLQSLTPSDVQELNLRVPSPRKFGSRSVTPSTSRFKTSQSSKLLSRVKDRLSKESPPFRLTPVKFRLKIWQNRSQEELGAHSHAEEHHALGAFYDDNDLLCDYDSDAQTIDESDLIGDVSQNSQSQPSCSQPSGTCLTNSAEFQRNSASTVSAVDSRSSHSHECIPSLGLNPAYDRTDAQDLTSSQASRLGRFPFENIPKSRRDRKWSQNSDIALAAETLFNTISPSVSTQNMTETTKRISTGQDLIDIQASAVQNPVSCAASAGHCSAAFSGVVASNQSTFESTVLFDNRDKTLVVSGVLDPEDRIPESPKSSLHLYNMRISQHLRSMSDVSDRSLTHAAPESIAHNRMESTEALSQAPGSRSIAQLSDGGIVCVSASPIPVIGKDISDGSVPTCSSSPDGSVLDLYTCGSSPNQCFGPRSDDAISNEPPLSKDCSLPSGSKLNCTNVESPLDDVLHEFPQSRTKPPSKRLYLRRGSKAHAYRRARFSNSPALARMSIIETRLDNNKDCGEDSGEPIPSQNAENEPYRGTQDSSKCDQLYNGFDGPSDLLSVPAAPMPLESPHQRGSVADNYEETTVLWENALRAHQEDTLNPQRKRGSSFSNVSRKSSRHSRGSSDASEARMNSLLKPSPQEQAFHAPRIALKRVNTTHSFDRLIVPGKGSTARPALLTSSIELHRSPARRSVGGRTRSISQPSPDRSTAQTGDQVTSQLLIPGVQLPGRYIPDITLTDLEPASEPSALPRLAPRKLTGLQAWSRYPSHNRKERNASAGIADNVVVRDFEPDVGSRMKSSHSKNKMRYGIKSKWRTRTMILKGKFLTDIPNIFKNRTDAGPRRRQHGHRSSISVGGALEYPELELLPPSEPQLPMAREDFPRDPDLEWTSVDSSTNLSTKSRSRRVISPKASTRLGSSNYDSIPDQDSEARNFSNGRLTADGWADIYGEFVPRQDKQRVLSETIPPLDGAFGTFPFSRPTSPSATSLPSMIRRRAFDSTKVGRKRAMSAQAIRRSTYDLCKMLDEVEEAELARALKAADDAFKD